MASASYGKTLEKAFEQFQVSFNSIYWCYFIFKFYISTVSLTECIFLYVVCEQSVNHRFSIKCNLCQTISHLKFNDLNYAHGLCLKNLNISWYCRTCCANIFPFTNINNYRLYLSLNNAVNTVN